jgi:hypothetical protein
VTEPQNQPINQKPRPGLAAGAVLALAWLIQLVVVLGPGFGGGLANDERAFHLPTIRLFAEQMPAPDLSDYNVASTPGYHLLLALATSFGADSDTAMRIVGGQFAVALAVLVAFWLGCRVRWQLAVLLSLPAWVSSYMIGPMVLALPEAAGWLGVLAILVIALRQNLDRRWLAAASGVLVFLVCVRQVHLWAAAPIWLAAWLGSQETTEKDRLVPTPGELDIVRRLPGTALAFAFTLPAFLVVAWFIVQWGGPVPPTFQTGDAADAIQGAAVHSGWNPATPAMVLALFGMLAPAFLVAVFSQVLAELKSKPQALWFVIAAAGVSLVVSVVPATSMSVEHGRWTGLWTLADKLPIVADRSVLIVGLAIAGGAMLAGMLLVVSSRQRLVVGGSLLAFTVAQSANYQSWARYLLPMVLLALVLLAGLAIQRIDRPSIRHVIGPLALAGALAAGSLSRIFG